MEATPQLLMDITARLAEKTREYLRIATDPARLEPENPLLRETQRAAAVRGWFSAPRLIDEVEWALAVPEETADRQALLHDLRAMCIVDPANPDRWILRDRYREASIALLAEEGKLEETARAAADDPHAQLVDQMLTGGFDPDRASTRDLVTASDVGRWLAAVPGRDAPRADYSAALELNLRNDELDRLSRGIVGREAELSRLMEFVHDAWRRGSWRLPLLRLEGIGGIGKSTLLAEFVRRRLVSRYPDAILVWIDYDRLRIRSDEVTTVLAELSRQLGWALPDVTGPLQEARRRLREEPLTRTAGSNDGAMTSRSLSESGDADPGGGSEEQVAVRAATDIVAIALRQAGGETATLPVLVVLDTVEQLERSEKSHDDVLLALQMLRERALPKLALIASGRSVFSRGLTDEVEDHPEPLLGLSRAFSRQLLAQREQLPEEHIERLIGAFADLSEEEFRQRVGIPMLLTLLARLDREGRLDLSGDDLDYIRNAASAEMAAGYIYNRVLDHLPEELRRIAHPGLVLRQMSAEVLRQVIWPVIEPGKNPLDAAEAEALFERLTREAWLVDGMIDVDPPAVQHRAELRRAMLLLMYEDPDPAVRRELTELNRRARDWYRDKKKAGDSGALLETVYHALALAVLTGKASSLRITEVRAVRDRLKDIVTDFPEQQRPAVSALVLGEADPATIAALPANLRIPVLGERLRGFASRRQYREGVAFCAALPEEDRGRTPSLAWLAVRCFLQSGQWSSLAAAIAPLVADHRAPGLRFGKGRPSLLPYMASFMIPWLGPAEARKLALGPRPSGISDWVSRRYDLITDLFVHLEDPSDATAAIVETDVMEMLAMLHRRVPAGDNRRLAAILMGLQLRLNPDLARRSPDRLAGLAQIGLAALQPLISAKDSLSSARLVTLCRSIDAEIARTGRLRQPLACHWVAMFDDFHTPLGLALANAVTNPAQAYSIADTLWPLWPIRPHDFRPNLFADACQYENLRPERFKTLVALADRAELMPRLLEIARQAGKGDPDLNAIVTGIQRWRRALAPISPAS